MRVLRWGAGIVGIAEFTYPHPEGWTFSELDRCTTLDKLDVKMLTAAFRRRWEAAPHCLTYWRDSGLALVYLRIA